MVTTAPQCHPLKTQTIIRRRRITIVYCIIIIRYGSTVEQLASQCSSSRWEKSCNNTQHLQYISLLKLKDFLHIRTHPWTDAESSSLYHRFLEYNRIVSAFLFRKDARILHLVGGDLLSAVRRMTDDDGQVC